MKDSAQKGFVLLARQNKVTTTDPINRQANTKLFAAIDSYPHYAFSPERRAACLAQSLQAIEAVINTPKRKRNLKAMGGASQC